MPSLSQHDLPATTTTTTTTKTKWGGEGKKKTETKTLPKALCLSSYSPDGLVLQCVCGDLLLASHMFSAAMTLNLSLHTLTKA